MLNTIGFLGCGNMGGAIARAVCKAADPQNVWLANRTAAKAEALAAELGCNTTINDEVAGRCDLIFLAVKPQMMRSCWHHSALRWPNGPAASCCAAWRRACPSPAFRRWRAATAPSSASCPTRPLRWGPV